MMLSGFADEISEDPRQQLSVLEENGLRFLELRSVWGTGVLDLSPAQVRDFRTLLDDAGIGVSALGSPIGKVPIRSDMEDHFARFQTAVERALQFGTTNIRIFSFYHPGETVRACRAAVLYQIRRMTEYAAAAGITLLHENEKGIYGDVPSRCLDLLRTVNDPALRATFDPANFIQSGVDPCAEAWPVLGEYVAYFHIKDAHRSTGHVVPAGQGDAGLEEILRQAATAGFQGFLSLEPHLVPDDPRYGSTGRERFTTAVQALRGVLERVGTEAR